ncbi:MAG: hypothetical protein F8N37_15840 [Telmatospirillum sp.]|nr:hypothetical protein [Telmatospirillum sp.]
MACDDTIDAGTANRLGARDFIDLAALGTAARGASDIAAIAVAIEDLVGHLWSPGARAVAGAVADLLAAGSLIATAGPAGRQDLTTSAQGRWRLVGLLTRPTDCPACPAGLVGLTLKMAFIDLAPPSARQTGLDLADCVYERELPEWHRQCSSCPRRGVMGRMWLDIETDRVQRAIASAEKRRPASCGTGSGRRHPQPSSPAAASGIATLA